MDNKNPLFTSFIVYGPQKNQSKSFGFEGYFPAFPYFCKVKTQ